MAGQGAKLTLGVEKFRLSANLVGADRIAPERRISRQKRGNLVFALLALQRAGAIDQRAAGLQQRDRMVEQPRLKGDELAEIGLGFEPRNVRMPPHSSCG